MCVCNPGQAGRIGTWCTLRTKPWASPADDKAGYGRCARHTHMETHRHRDTDADMPMSAGRKKDLSKILPSPCVRVCMCVNVGWGGCALVSLRDVRCPLDLAAGMRASGNSPLHSGFTNIMPSSVFTDSECVCLCVYVCMRGRVRAVCVCVCVRVCVTAFTWSKSSSEKGAARLRKRCSRRSG